MNESQNEVYLEPMLECDHEIIDPMGESALAAPAPNVNINVCNSHC
jgi:hypothetical protein